MTNYKYQINPKSQLQNSINLIWVIGTLKIDDYLEFVICYLIFIRGLRLRENWISLVNSETFI